jgi:hypothetical protein
MTEEDSVYDGWALAFAVLGPAAVAAWCAWLAQQGFGAGVGNVGLGALVLLSAAGVAGVSAICSVASLVLLALANRDNAGGSRRQVVAAVSAGWLFGGPVAVMAAIAWWS